MYAITPSVSACCLKTCGDAVQQSSWLKSALAQREAQLMEMREQHQRLLVSR